MMNNRIEKLDRDVSQDDDLSEHAFNKPEVRPEKIETPPLEKKESPGVILKRARESQGLSLQIVHEATKIPVDALRSIEEGYKVRVLSPFYYSGFIKMYAGYLNVEISEVVNDYKKEELPELIKQDIDEFEMPLWGSKIFSRERKQQMVIIGGILLALFLLFKVIGFLTSLKPKLPVEKSATKIEAVKKELKEIAETPRQEVHQQVPVIVTPKIKPQVKPVATSPYLEVKPSGRDSAPTPVVTSSPAPEPARPIAVAVPTTIQRNIILTVRANQNSWLMVRTDENIVFQSTLRAGAVETWLADEEIEISGRNINELDFELNGKMIGTLGRKNRNAKKVVITKSGLSVKQ